MGIGFDQAGKIYQITIDPACKRRLCETRTNGFSHFPDRYCSVKFAT
jgi:hypothetical protein